MLPYHSNIMSCGQYVEFHINRKKTKEATVELHHSAQDVYVYLATAQMNSS